MPHNYIYNVLPKMILRKLRKDKKIKKLKSLISISAFIIILGLVLIFQKNIRATISEIAKGETNAVGAANIEGTIIDKNNYPKYTHTIVTKKKKEIGIKSSSLNLNDYLSKNLIAIGEYDTNGIANIDAIKLVDDKIIIRGNKYTFISNGVIFDFGDQNEIKAIQNSDGTISINVSDQNISTFQRFSCRKILKGRPCEELIEEYDNKGKDTFDSVQGYTFHKHSDKYRLTFDDNYGYIFKDISDENMLNLSNSFQIMNGKFIIDNKLQEIQNNCKNEKDSATDITKSDTHYGNTNDIIVLLLDTKTEKGKNAKCSLTFDIRNGRKVTNSSFEIN